MVSSLVVIPIAIYGISLISQMQLATQPIWLAAAVPPLVYIAWQHPQDVFGLDALRGQAEARRRRIDQSHAVRHGGVDACCLLLPQIGERVSYLRFSADA